MRHSRSILRLRSNALTRQRPPSRSGYRPILLIAIVALFSCTGKKTAVKNFDTGDDEDAIVDANIKRNIKPLADDDVAVIETTEYGNIVVELYPNIAPLMVERFKKLAREGFYNGTIASPCSPDPIMGQALSGRR